MNRAVPLYIALAGAAAIIIGAPSALAETVVGGTLTEDTVWSSSGSPYLLTGDVNVPTGMSLTIASGTRVSLAPGASFGSIIVDGGKLAIAGAPDAKVIIDNGILRIFIKNGSASVSYADLHTQGIDLQLYSSVASIDHSTIRGSTGTGIYTWNSKVGISSSRIEDNAFAGIYILAGGAGGSKLSVHDSVISGNQGYAILNDDPTMARAENVWWGSAAGPSYDGPNRIRGAVAYDPWLKADPDPAPVPCCSSVIFLPGLEGTRLYEDTPARPGWRMLGRSTTTDKLWEPGSNADMSRLRLGPDGTSSHPGIYSGAPIDKAFGLFGVYGGFMSFMDGLAERGAFNEWRAFGYDWRRPVPEAASAAEKRSTTTESLLDVVMSMASSSKTGKVSIVAHSNGGLVAKYLVKVLADMGKATIIDSVISVGVPFLGTPAAIPALLYGDGQSIAWGLIATKANARGLADNMPSAYSLLPSARYFGSSAIPTISSPSSTSMTASAQDSFLAGTGLINRALLSAAQAVHGILDDLTWPIGIARWAVVGWNKDTTNGLAYGTEGSRAPTYDLYGDGTVKSESASFDAGQILAEDLDVQSRLEKADISHGNLLEASATQALIEDVLTGHSGPSSGCRDNPAVCNTEVLSEIAKLPGITVGDMDWKALELRYEASRKQLRVSVHSPVALHIYDSLGRHTGELPMPATDADTGEPIEPGLYKLFEAKIPGSSFGTNDGDDSIILPDNGDTYTISMEGTGMGYFALDVERLRATSTVEKVGWSEVPVAPSSSATTTFHSDADLQVSGHELSSSSPMLSLDYDGDGIVDATSTIGDFDQSKALDLVGKACRSFGRGAVGCRGMDSRIRSLKDRIGPLKGAIPGWFRHERDGIFSSIENLFKGSRR